MQARTDSEDISSPPSLRDNDVSEKIFQFEETARRGYIFMLRNAADGRFVHFNQSGDIFQNHRFQVMHAVDEKRILLPHDFSRHFQNRRGALQLRALTNQFACCQ